MAAFLPLFKIHFRYIYIVQNEWGLDGDDDIHDDDDGDDNGKDMVKVVYYENDSLCDDDFSHNDNDLGGK